MSLSRFLAAARSFLQKFFGSFSKKNLFPSLALAGNHCRVATLHYDLSRRACLARAICSNNAIRSDSFTLSACIMQTINGSRSNCRSFVSGAKY
jgi:hypothetical protein